MFVCACDLRRDIHNVLGVRDCENERYGQLGRMEMDLHCRRSFVTIIGAEADAPLKEGLLTVVIAIASYFFIHNYPTTARFLTPKEKECVVSRLEGDSDAIRDEKFTWDGVIRALKDPKVWLYGFCFHTISVPISSLGTFLPTIINQLGYTPAQTQLLSIPPYVASFFLTMAAAVYAERTKLRAPFVMASSTLAIVGFIILTASHRPEVSYGGTILATAGAYCTAAIVAGWPANNVSGQTKRAIASAVQISIGNLGGVVGSQLYRPKWAPRFLIGNCVVRI